MPGLAPARAGVLGPPGAADVTLGTLQQQLVGVVAQLRAVDADIQAARAAGEADEVKALRVKEKLLMEKEKLLMERANLLLRVHGPETTLKPGVCLLLASRFLRLTARN